MTGPVPERSPALRILLLCLLLAASAVASLSAPALAAANTPPQCYGLPGDGGGDPWRIVAGTATDIHLSCADLDSDPLTLSIVSGPNHGGTVGSVVDDGQGSVTVRYTPADTYAGPEAFSFKASDGQVDSQPATMNFDVQGLAPTCATPEPIKVRTGRTAWISPSLPGANAMPACSSFRYPTTFTITKQPAHGALTGDAANGGVGYAPDAGYSGTDSVSFTLSNDKGTSNEVTQAIEVGPNVNHTPECWPTPLTARAGQTKDVSIFCTDMDADQLSYDVDTTGTNGTVGKPSAGQFGTPSVRYTAAAQAGDDSFAITATDELGAASAPKRVSVTVRPADYNTAPQCMPESGPLEVEAGTTSFTGAAPPCYDADGDPLTWVIDSQPAHGTAVVKHETSSTPPFDWVQYTSTDAGYNGADSFEIHAVDRPGGTAEPRSSAPVTRTVKIVGAKPPTCYTSPGVAIRAGGERMLFLYCAPAGTSTASTDVTYEITTPPAHGTVTFAYGAKSGAVLYKAEAGYDGIDTFAYRATNAAGSSSIVTQRITVAPNANTAPDCFGAASWSEEVRAGKPHSVGLSCYDADGDALTYSVALKPAHGTLSAVTQPASGEPWAAATIVYTPDAGYTGSDAFTFTASDGRAISTAGSRSFTVVPADKNTAPQCFGNATRVAANASVAIASLASSCYDADGDTVTASITAQPQHGTLSAPDAKGLRTYTPDDPSYTGTDTIRFTGSDGPDTSAESTVEIQITAPSQILTAPISTPAGGAVRLQNYVDAGGESQLSVPRGDVSQFPNGCMPLELGTTLPEAEGSTIDPASVKLVLTPPAPGTAKRFDMAKDADGTWKATLDCADTGELTVEWKYTDGDGEHSDQKPLGGITLIDPQGVVYDQQVFDQAVAAGKADDEARSLAAIEGATVTLERQGGDGTWAKVPAGSSTISPNVNPQVTGKDGLYQWDVAAGHYRVMVTGPGYEPVTSKGVDIPPPVLDLHIGMTRLSGAAIPGPDTGTPGDSNPNPTLDPSPNPGPGAGGSPAAGGGGATPATPATPAAGPSAPPTAPATTPKPAAKPAPSCAKLKGAKKAACSRAAALTKALAACAKKKGKAKSTCVKQARALDKCVPLKGRKKATCVSRAKTIGRKR